MRGRKFAIIFAVVVWTAVFILTGVLLAHAQEIPKLSQQQLEEYVAILLYDRVQMLKDADKDKMALMDQKRVSEEQASALAAYWRAYVDGLTRKK